MLSHSHILSSVGVGHQTWYQKLADQFKILISGSVSAFRLAQLHNQTEPNRAGPSQRTEPAHVHTAHSENHAVDSLAYPDFSVV